MELKILHYGPRFGQNFEYVATYIKGKKGKQPKDLRVLVKGLTDEKEYLILVKPTLASDIGIIDFDLMKVRTRISPTQVKTDKLIYNYYYLRTDPKDLADVLSFWKSFDPFVHVGNYNHKRISNILNYNGTFEFQGVTY